MGETRGGDSRGNGILRGVVILMALVVVALLIVTLLLRIVIMVTPSVGGNAQLDALERANDAVNSVNIMLSFLEGASVLIGLGFGAAALYGLRNTDEVRKDLENEVSRVQRLRDDVLEKSRAAEERDQEMQTRLERQIEFMDGFRPDLERLRDLRAQIVRAQEELALVQQADQEFRLGNYNTAYRFAEQVLSTNPDNWLALYIAGWLEVHQRDALEEGIVHLRHVTKLKTDWPAAMAAYGVALRRKARRSSGEERANLFNQAEGALLQALGHSPNLMDFNSESYWGPVGGIRLETGRMDSAIEAYEQALLVTPDSSYPAGNLATLYLQRAHRTASQEDRDRALDAFQRTVRAARREQIMKPSDYYLWMDIAQAQTILGQRDPAHFESAQEALTSALQAQPSSNMMETSLRGWRSLLDHCPDDSDWEAVRAEIRQSIGVLEAQVTARGN
jgi:tetratricopeptide (TPR) repeat protein